MQNHMLIGETSSSVWYIPPSLWMKNIWLDPYGWRSTNTLLHLRCHSTWNDLNSMGMRTTMQFATIFFNAREARTKQMPCQTARGRVGSATTWRLVLILLLATWVCLVYNLAECGQPNKNTDCCFWGRGPTDTPPFEFYVFLGFSPGFGNKWGYNIYG